MRHLAVVLLALAALAQARIHELDISNDARSIFSIEAFGFRAGGTLKLHLKQFSVVGGGSEPVQAGFILHKTTSEAAVLQGIEEVREKDVCILDAPLESDAVVAVANATTPVTLVVAEEGMYDLIFTRCTPESGKVSFKLSATFANPGPNYLSAGEQPLPVLYGVMTVLFAAATVVWIWWVRKHAESIHTLHHLFTVLVTLKALTLLFEAIQYGSISVLGHPTGWSAVFYIFMFAKGLLFFVIVLMIGTGWSLLKPFLSTREKRIVLVVLPLQVIVNIAIIVQDEMAPGSLAFGTWRDILHIADIICCCLILLPIYWSINHMRNAAAADGKAREVVDRLSRFRSFYLYTVGYIYVTRIIVYIMQSTLGFGSFWLAPFFAESVTLVYYVATGYRFRPGSDNPYVRVRADSDADEDDEFGLGEDDVDTAAAVEMAPTGAATASTTGAGAAAGPAAAAGAADEGGGRKTRTVATPDDGGRAPSNRGERDMI